MNKQLSLLNKTLIIGVIILFFSINLVPVKGNIPFSTTENNNLSDKFTWPEKSTVHFINKLYFQDEFIINVITQMNESLYLGYLENITAFGPRVTGTTACHEAGDYIYNELENMGLDVRYHYWNYLGYSDRNIEATLYGTNETSNAIYIICGHYDTVSGCPGADDDASGVATVLSAAFILSKYSFDYTIRFLAFSGEEQWMLGSHEYAREAYENGDNIIAVLNVDMIGFALTSTQGSFIKIYKNVASTWISDFTISVSQEYYDYIFLEVIPLGESPSDQLYFWEYGYDGVFYHEYEFNYYYHTPNDTIENMNITYATKFSKLIIATLSLLAQLSSYPPATPTISGPTNGTAGKQYNFTVVTIDPDEDNVYYYIDWGDGTSSGWIGPYSSGIEIIASHIWDISGTYLIRAKAKDNLSNFESNWSEPLIINIEYIIDIQKIKGGFFRINALIKNNYGAAITDVHWNITIDGGAFIGKKTSGRIDIPMDEEATIKSRLILGFGPIEVTVTAEIPEYSETISRGGFIYLFYIQINPGGE